ncbi:hypothetical protein GCM10027343_09610 [Noviherbaspirillum agri]
MTRRKNQDGLKEVLSAFFQEIAAKTPANQLYVAATREDLCAELVAFGEDAVATKVAKLSKGRLAEVFRRAGELDAQSSASSHGHSLCLAAVEIVEGASRPLARRRRRSIR